MVENHVERDGDEIEEDEEPENDFGLLNTIKLPRNLKLLQNCLPKSNYEDVVPILESKEENIKHQPSPPKQPVKEVAAPPPMQPSVERPQ